MKGEMLLQPLSTNYQEQAISRLRRQNMRFHSGDSVNGYITGPLFNDHEGENSGGMIGAAASRGAHKASNKFWNMLSHPNQRAIRVFMDIGTEYPLLSGGWRTHGVDDGYHGAPDEPPTGRGEPYRRPSAKEGREARKSDLGEWDPIKAARWGLGLDDE